MAKIHWSILKLPKTLVSIIWMYLNKKWWRLKLTIISLFYNDFISWNYAGDIALEPIFWFVENFTGVIGPILIVMLSSLTGIIVYIAYYIGIPYWWEKSPTVTIILLIIGHWLLINVLFHYYMGVKIPAGYPPEGGLIPEAVSICKKCIKPKPPRTHHCSICKKCVLKMDHHCPWLNNCVGHYNHRHFFLYMIFTGIGIIFIILFGIEIAYQEIILDYEQELDGHPVKINKNFEIIPVTEMMDHLSNEELDEIAKHEYKIKIKEFKKRLIIFAALICVTGLLILGGLSWWHGKLITYGQTSIEARINSKEIIKYNKQGKTYQNPYDFGIIENWKIFLGLKDHSWLCVLLPSTHSPSGNGLTWQTIYDKKHDENISI